MNHNSAFLNVFKTYSIECVSDPRFKIQGAGESLPQNLESWIPEHVQKYSTPWIQDSRFKVQMKFSQNLESLMLDPGRIQYEYVLNTL